MADTKASAFTDAAANLTDSVPYIKDPAGTPLNRRDDVGDILSLNDARTKTLTNTTLNADGTGNVITNIGASEVKADIITGQGVAPAFASGDKFLISSGGTLEQADFDDIPTGIANVVEDTTPQLGGQLDVNGNSIGDGTNELLTFTEDALAVNHINIENEATGAGPIVSAVGDDLNIDLHLNAKGTGSVKTNANIDVTGAITLTSTVDGRDIAADGSKLDGIEALADVTDETNVKAALDGATIAAVTVASTDKVLIQDVDDTDNLKTVTAQSIADLGSGGTLNNIVEDTTPQLGGQLDVNGQAIGDGTNELLTFVEDASAVNHLEIENQATAAGPILRSTGDDANVDLHLDTKGTGNVKCDDDLDVTGAITVTSTVDGRDIATDGSKLDGIEALADVTDETNVKAALDGATIAAVTVASTDKVLIQDVDDTDNLKTVTAQSIADLAPQGTLNNIVEDTTPQLGGQLDVNGQSIGDGTNELIEFTEDAVAVNHINIENEATGAGPIISAVGGDVNIDLNLNGKATGNVVIRDGTDVTKALSVEVSGATTSTTTTLAASQTVNRTVTLPDATTTLVGTDATQTLSNKTISGSTLTGVHDGGGATSLEIPNGAGGTAVSLAGQVTVDTTSRSLNFHDGTAEVVLQPQISKAFFLESPVAADDFPILRVDSAVTLTKTVYAISGGTNWVGQLVEATDAQGTGDTNTQSVDSTVTATTTVTSYSNAVIAAGSYVRIKTTSVSGAVTWLHVTFYYRHNA